MCEAMAGDSVEQAGSVGLEAHWFWPIVVDEAPVPLTSPRISGKQILDQKLSRCAHARLHAPPPRDTAEAARQPMLSEQRRAPVDRMIGPNSVNLELRGFFEVRQIEDGI